MNPFGSSGLASRFSLLTMGRLAGAVAIFGCNVFIARQFGADVLGIVAVSMAVSAVLAVLISCGYSAIGTILVAEYRARRSSGLVRGLVQTAHRTMLVSAAAIASAAAAASYLAPHLVPNACWWLLPAIVMAALAQALSNFGCDVLTGVNRQLEAFLPDTFVKPLLILLCVAAVAALYGQAGPVQLVTAFAIASCLAAALTLVLQRVHLRADLAQPAIFDRRRWRRMALPWMATSLLWDFAIELHLLLAGVVALPARVAVLHVCFRFQVLAEYGMRTIYALLAPRILTSNALEDGASLTSDLALANVLALAYAMATFIFMWLAGPVLLGLFGGEFSAGMPVLLLVCSTLMVRAVFGPAPLMLAMKDHHAITAWVLAGGLVLSLSLSAGLYRLFDVTGIAMAFAATSAVTYLVLWRLATGLTGIDCSIFATGRQGAQGLISGCRQFLRLARPAVHRPGQ